MGIFKEYTTSLSTGKSYKVTFILFPCYRLLNIPYEEHGFLSFLNYWGKDEFSGKVWVSSGKMRNNDSAVGVMIQNKMYLNKKFKVFKIFENQEIYFKILLSKFSKWGSE